MKSVIIILFTFLVALAVADPISLFGIVRDFTPETNPDFESYEGDEKGIVLPLYGVDQLPALSNGTHATVTSLQSFASWYRDTAGVNIPIQVTLDLNDEGNGNYTYDSDMFFPIDNIGFGNNPGTTHNYDFTAQFRNSFVAEAGQFFYINGNDDIWVFVNGELVIDLGGVHAPESESITLDIAAGTNCTLDIYTAQRHTPTSELHITTNILLNSAVVSVPIPGRTAYVCEVLFPNFCAGSPVPSEGVPSKRQTVCPDDPTLTFGAESYSFDNFNVISFGDFSAVSGDVEGRLAVRNDLNLPSGGYSIGYELRTGGPSAIDQSLPYSLVVGRDAVFASGAVYPDGSNFPYAGAEEDIFVGGTFTAPDYLSARRTGGPCATTGCLDADFDNAQAYYTLLSNDFAGESDTGTAVVDQTGLLTITCTDATNAYISVTIYDTDFNQANNYAVTNCYPNGQLVINVVGTNDVSFQGNNINWTQEKTLYNIIGVGRTVTILTEVDGNLLMPNNNYLQPGTGVVKGLVIAGTVLQALQINRVECDTPAPPPHPQPNVSLCPSFEAACTGLDLPLGSGVYSFRDFNVIVFGDFTANTGDIEGRLAAQGDVTLGAGFSIGYELQTLNNQPDNTLPYSVVVGGNLIWISGQQYPTGTGSPYPGEEEGIFVGGSYETSLDVTGSCAPAGAGCLDAYFEAALECYMGFQSVEASYEDDVTTQIQWSGLFITCNNPNAEYYYMTLTPEQMSQFTYYSLSNCNLQSSWTINIVGTADVYFSGDSFPAPSGAVLYNIQGSGRTIFVNNDAVNGHILAPQNFLNQTGGVILGKVVVQDVLFALQVNRENVCPNPGNITIYAVTPDANSDVATISTSLPSALHSDDVVHFPTGNTATVVSVSGTSITFDRSVSTNAGDRIYTVVPGTAGRGTPPATSSAAQVSIALILIVAALLF